MSTPGFLRRPFLTLLVLSLLASPVPATTLRYASPEEMIPSAGRIIRGECVGATDTKIEVGGLGIPVTRYTFRVTEYLKGGGPGILSFRQAGSRSAGRAPDLGRLAGLPVYRVGREYVLLLVPESRIGLTSPAAAGQGAYLVQGAGLIPLRPFPAPPGSVASPGPTPARPPGAPPTMATRHLTYEELRALVRGRSR